jgi:hypothetical protein
MAAVLIFFVRLATPIFVLLAIGLLFGIRRMSQAFKERHAAVFGLEREIANRHMSQAVSTLLIVSFMAIAEFTLVVFLFPNIPWLAQYATPTMNPLLTQTSTFPLEFMETLGVVTPNETTMTPQASGCIPGQVDITSPKPGDQVQGSVTLQGTANIPNFGFYKYEYAPIGSDIWATIVANNKPIQDGNLGSWDTSAIATGDYQLRLVVTDNQGSELPACVIPLRVKAP